MLALILAEDDAFSRSVSHRARLQHYSVIRYRDPVKLADNLPELRPDALIIRCEDYPLHWETLAAELLCLPEMRTTKIIVAAQEEPAAARFFPAVLCISETEGPPGSARLSPEAAQRLSELLGAAKPQKQPGAEAVPRNRQGVSSRLAAAAEKQGRGGRFTR